MLCVWQWRPYVTMWWLNQISHSILQESEKFNQDNPFFTEFIIFGTLQSCLPNLRLLTKFTYTHVSVLDPEILSTLTFPANKYTENVPAIKYRTRENNQVSSFFFYADCGVRQQKNKMPYCSSIISVPWRFT